MELFLLLSDLQSKNLFYKKFLAFKNESKLVLKTGNGIISSLLLMCSDVLTGVGTPHIKCIQLFTAPHKISNLCNGTDGWVTIRRIMPLRGSILQAGICKILSLSENPRWRQVWQKSTKCYLVPKVLRGGGGDVHNFDFVPKFTMAQVTLKWGGKGQKRLRTMFKLGGFPG